MTTTKSAHCVRSPCLCYLWLQHRHQEPVHVCLCGRAWARRPEGTLVDLLPPVPEHDRPSLNLQHRLRRAIAIYRDQYPEETTHARPQ